MDETTVTVFAEFRAKAGMEEELGRLLKELIEPTRKEKGCAQYDLHVDNSQRGHFLFYENWTSMALLQAHLNSPHLTAVLGRSAKLLEEPVRVTFATRIA